MNFSSTVVSLAGTAVQNDAPASDIAIIGAGPYGLSAAAHLRGASNLNVRIFGEPMSFWKGMPRGMLLRSARDASYIGFPDGELTLEGYQADTGQRFGTPVPLETFVEYGEWFARTAVPDVDGRRVTDVRRSANGFLLTLQDGEAVRAARVVVAAGIEAFPAHPPAFDGLPARLVTHSSEHADLSALAGGSVIVVGGGQSALESAALLHEAGIDVEVIVRAPQLTWLRGGSIQRRLGRLKSMFYAQTDVGPAGLSRLVAVPRLFTALPHALQARLAHRAIRPAGARWLVSRLADVPITTGRSVVQATAAPGAVELVLDDGSHRTAGHVILATGYRVDAARYGFLAPELIAAVRRVDGYPVLNGGFESSVPGLHFLGAPAARSFGPTMRFVSGSWYAARRLTAHLGQPVNAG